MRAKLLIVDDEPEVLKALERLLKKHFELHLFDNAEEALLFLANNHCHLILSDMKLPRMNGAEFLSHAAKLSPSSKKIVLTGHADIDEAKDVVNNANISRYFTKPWQNKELLSGLSELVTLYNDEQKHKRVIHSLKGSNIKLSAAKKTMNNDELIDFSARLINLLVGDDTGHNYRIAQQARLMAKILNASNEEQEAIYLAGLYYSVGLASLPEELRSLTREQMSPTQQHQWISSVQVSAEILRDIKPLKATAHIVKHIYEHFDGTGLPDKLSGDDIPLGARILSVVIRYDRILQGKMYTYTLNQEEALSQVKSLSGKVFDVKVLLAFESLLGKKESEHFEYAISVDKIVEGMVASEDILNHHGQKLIAKGVIISQAMIEALLQYEETRKIPMTIFVKSQVEHYVQCANEL